MLHLTPQMLSFLGKVVSGIANAAVNYQSGREERALEERRLGVQEQLHTLTMQQQEKMHQENLLAQGILSYQRGKEERALEERRLSVQAHLHTLTMQQQEKIHREKLEAQGILFEKVKKLQKQLASYNRQTQLLVANGQREAILELAEDNQRFKNWPLRIHRTQILGQHRKTGTMPLKILIVPPQIDFDRPQSINGRDNFPEEIQLSMGLKRFLEQNYPLESPNRPTELLDGAWDSKRYYGGSAIKNLHTVLQSEAMLILEMVGSGDSIDLRVAYWGHGQPDYWYHTISSKIPLSALLQDPQTPSVTINKVLTQALCFVASWFIDVHHLVYSENPETVPPLLPRLLPSLMQDTLTSQVLAPLIPQFMTDYRAVFEALEQEQSHIVPELALQVAKSLSKLEDKSLAKEHLEYSLQKWLAVRGFPEVKVKNLLDVIIGILQIQDQNYIEALRVCLENMEMHNDLKSLNAACDALDVKLLDGEIQRDQGGPTLYGSY